MLKRIATSTVLALGFTVLSAAPAAAQMTDWPIAVKAGLNVSNLSVDDFLGVEPDSRSGLLAGVSFSKPIRDAFSVQLEALITQKGAKVEDLDLFGTELKARVNYFEIPVLGRYTFRLNERANAHVLAGPAFAFKLSDTQELDDIELEGEDKIDVAGVDVGFAIGGAVEFMEKWTVDLRYTFGLSNLNDGSALFPSDIVKARNRTLSLSVGYRFN